MVVSGVLAVLLGGCSGEDQQDEPTSTPLQPLIYTEDPELTPEGAAVREQRLRRQLLDGSEVGPWGRLEESTEGDMPRLVDAHDLGEAIVRALTERDERLWEQVFVSAESYGELVNVSSGRASEFVDNQMGESLRLWELFAQTHSSQVPEGGLSQQVEFEEIELGSSRRLDGSSTDDPDEVAQYWNNRVSLRHADAGVSFELTIPRIFRIPSSTPVDDGQAPQPFGDSGEEPSDTADDGDPAEVFELRIGSEVNADPKFRTFLDVGLHLKPQLLRTEEYPFPLGIGSFWRYRRYHREHDGEQQDFLERRFDEQPQGVSAGEVIVEVRDVSRYGTIRLVELLRSYEDRRRTRQRDWWVVTPRRIYVCDSTCRANIEQVDWLLSYFDYRDPIMVFPTERGDQWGSPGDDGQPVFVVDDQWHKVETPSGTFSRGYRIEGTGPLASDSRYFTDVDMTRYFAPERGIVRRELEPGPQAEEDVAVIEELVEYRIMH